MLTKVHLFKATVFLIVMYECESWTIKKAEHQRIDAFELWCWRRFLRVPWTTRSSNQSVLKEINPEYSLEGLRLKLQYFGYLMQRGNKRSWRWERLKAGGGDNRGWDGWMTSLTQWTRVWASSRSWWWTEAWRAAVHGVAKRQTWLNDWTKLILYPYFLNFYLMSFFSSRIPSRVPYYIVIVCPSYDSGLLYLWWQLYWDIVHSPVLLFSHLK